MRCLVYRTHGNTQLGSDRTHAESSGAKFLDPLAAFGGTCEVDLAGFGGLASDAAGRHTGDFGCLADGPPVTRSTRLFGHRDASLSSLIVRRASPDFLPRARWMVVKVAA